MKSGIIAINKPEGISSARVVSRVKNALGAKKVGHTGTLDPFATGLLLCSINKGTRISRFLLDGAKRYLATVNLGIETDTYDLTGKVVSIADPDKLNLLTPEDIQKLVNNFQGPQKQVPPSFSALKHKGQPLYKLARQGQKIEKPPRDITVYEIAVHDIDLPKFEIEVFCSAGTYIRSLAHDMGEILGCGAHLSSLCRTQSSSFLLKNAVDLGVFETFGRQAAQNHILPLSDCLDFMPKCIVDSHLVQKIQYGQKIAFQELKGDSSKSGEFKRLVDSKGELFAIVQRDKYLEEYNYCCVFSP
jgi:tRNA pseudouridine55 synthase